MGLTGLDSYGLWHLYICRLLFSLSTFFVASFLFMKGTSCCVTRRNRTCYGKFLEAIGLHDFPLLCTSQIEASTSPPRETPPGVCIFGKFLFKSTPFPGRKAVQMPPPARSFGGGAWAYFPDSGW